MKTVFGVIVLMLIALACTYSFIYYLKRIKSWRLLDTQLSATVTEVKERTYRTRNRRNVHEYAYTYMYRYAGKEYRCATDWISDVHKVGDTLSVKISSTSPGVVLSDVDYTKSVGGLVVCVFGAVLCVIVSIVVILNAYYA